MAESNPGITLTGADEMTPLTSLIRLADLGAEIGLLYTHSPDGRNRYPRLPWIANAVETLKKRCALHICGERARMALFRDEFSGLVAKCGRVQINGRIDPVSLFCFCRQWPLKHVITQHNPANAQALSVGASNHQLLVDASGGQGQSPAEWLRPDTHKPVGFAGGLGPHNLREQLPRIAAVAKGTWWIDMEGRMRDGEDWFDCGRAAEVMSLWGEWRSAVTA